ncbi:MAG: site-specific DNA-methyltransferase [Lachnospiraceae bacterium]|nr:site-specific DNA-methyltransferase [Lachnospiraceae bacterium]
MRSKRNKTIEVSEKEGRRYIKECLKLKKPASEDEIRDKIIFGDTLKILPLLPKDSVKLMIADPPYNIDKDFNGNRFKQIPDEMYADYTRQWIEAAIPLLKGDASIYVCCDWTSSSVIESVLKQYFTVRNRITWQREKGRGSKSNWKNSMEDIWFATVSGKYTFNVEDVLLRRRVIAPYREDGKAKDWEEKDGERFRNTYPSNFWDDISVPYWSMAENTGHPTQKSEKLMAKLILASSDKGDLILDPFSGSGTTAVTAKKLGRHYCGIEQNRQYCIWAKKRLEMADEDSRIQGYTDGVFWERNTRAQQEKYVNKKK